MGNGRTLGSDGRHPSYRMAKISLACPVGLKPSNRLVVVSGCVRNSSYSPFLGLTAVRVGQWAVLLILSMVAFHSLRNDGRGGLGWWLNMRRGTWILGVTAVLGSLFLGTGGSAAEVGSSLGGGSDRYRLVRTSTDSHRWQPRPHGIGLGSQHLGTAETCLVKYRWRWAFGIATFVSTLLLSPPSARSDSGHCRGRRFDHHARKRYASSHVRAVATLKVVLVAASGILDPIINTVILRDQSQAQLPSSGRDLLFEAALGSSGNVPSSATVTLSTPAVRSPCRSPDTAHRLGLDASRGEPKLACRERAS